MFLLLLPYVAMPKNILVLQSETERITGFGIKWIKNGDSPSKRLSHRPYHHQQRFADSYKVICKATYVSGCRLKRMH